MRLVKPWDAILDLVYPNLCVLCETETVPTHELLCAICESKISTTQLHRLPENECTRRVQSVIPYRAAAMYRFYPGGLVQQIIHNIKYRDRPQVAVRIGRKYAQVIQSEEWVQTIDVIIPVPLHVVRLRKRGYNQSERFACGIAEVLKLPTRSKQLYRTRPTDTQTSKGREERLDNMQGAFDLQRPELLRDKHILLVDDVLTTGATIEACLSVMSSIEGTKLSFLTMAIAE